jgi:hypothetical protein
MHSVDKKTWTNILSYEQASCYAYGRRHITRGVFFSSFRENYCSKEDDSKKGQEKFANMKCNEEKFRENYISAPLI